MDRNLGFCDIQLACDEVDRQWFPSFER
jgi:hypothetical protein